MVKIRIGLREGTVDIEADGELVESTTTQAIVLMERLSELQLPATPVDAAPRLEPSTSVDDSENEGDKSTESSGAPTSAKGRARKKGGNKTKNWQYIPDLLDHDGWGKAKDFFEEKAPKTQNEKVAVIVAGLGTHLGRNTFDGNEIHSAFRAFGEKTPANLSGVLGNMATEGLGHSSDGKFQLDFKGTQLVEHDLPREEKKK